MLKVSSPIFITYKILKHPMINSINVNIDNSRNIGSGNSIHLRIFITTKKFSRSL